MSEAFTNQTLQSIAIDRAPDLFLRNCQAQPRRLLPGPDGQYREIRICRTFRAREHPFEFRRSQQAHPTRESIVRNAPAPESGDQAGTALGAACVQHLTTTSCRHAGTKTVGTSALDAAGLKSTFHDRCSEQLYREITGPAKLNRRHAKRGQKLNGSLSASQCIYPNWVCRKVLWNRLFNTLPVKHVCKYSLTFKSLMLKQDEGQWPVDNLIAKGYTWRSVGA